MTTLRLNSRGPEVELLQSVLQSLGYYNGAIDGIFGNQTSTIVRNFQSQNNLTTDGIVGQNTWKTLLTLPQYPILRQGSRGIYVKFLQQLLESNLIPVGIIDGIFGNQTLRAVEIFQTERGLTIDGIVGSNTWNLLAQTQ